MAWCCQLTVRACIVAPRIRLPTAARLGHSTTPFDAVGYTWLLFPSPADTDGAVSVGLGSTAPYASERRGSARSCCGAARLHGRAYPSGSDTAARCIRRRRLHRANGSAILGYVRRCIRAARMSCTPRVLQYDYLHLAHHPDGKQGKLASILHCGHCIVFLL